MNSVIEIHDSELESIELAEGAVELRFSPVYIHKSEGRPGIDAGTGWAQRARLVISNANIKRSFAKFPGELLAGYLKLEETVLNNEIPIPLNFRGKVELNLESWNDETVLISGDGAVLVLVGDPEYVEDFPRTQT